MQNELFSLMNFYDVSISSAHMQRQLMEQKLRQKRQTSGMMQASDRPKLRSIDLRPGSATSKGRELHGEMTYTIDLLN